MLNMEIRLRGWETNGGTVIYVFFSLQFIEVHSSVLFITFVFILRILKVVVVVVLFVLIFLDDVVFVSVQLGWIPLNRIPVITESGYYKYKYHKCTLLSFTLFNHLFTNYFQYFSLLFEYSFTFIDILTNELIFVFIYNDNDMSMKDWLHSIDYHKMFDPISQWL